MLIFGPQERRHCSSRGAVVLTLVVQQFAVLLQVFAIQVNPARPTWVAQPFANLLLANGRSLLILDLTKMATRNVCSIGVRLKE